MAPVFQSALSYGTEKLKNMDRRLLPLCVVVFAIAAVRVVDSTSVWPNPQVLEYQGMNMTVQYNVMEIVPIGHSSETLARGIERALKQIFPKLPEDSPSYLRSQEKSPKNIMRGLDGSVWTLEKLEVNVSSDNEDLSLETDESYKFYCDVSKGYGVCTLECVQVYGCLHGLETFQQLLVWDNFFDYDGELYFLAVNITDFPRFPYRGLLVDTARHFLPLPVLYEVVDALSAAKLNVLQIHLIDDQSWPLESKRWPLLAEKGAYSKRHIYKLSEMKEFVSYARQRGVRVIPSIDTPAHAGSIARSYPWVLVNYSCPGDDHWHLGNVNAVNDSAYEFLMSLFEEMNTVFTDPVIWIGGDEVTTGSWNCSSEVHEWMKERNITDINEVLYYYTQRVIDIVHKVGKTPYAWSDIRGRLGPTPGQTYPDVAVSAWAANFLDGEELQASTALGLKALRAGCYYIVEGTSRYTEPLTLYQCDPLNFTGSPEQKSQILGGHASRWGEHTDGTNEVQTTWPHVAAVGERLWSSFEWTNSSQAVEAFTGRLHTFRCQSLVPRGIPAVPLEVGFCPHEWGMKW